MGSLQAVCVGQNSGELRRQGGAHGQDEDIPEPEGSAEAEKPPARSIEQELEVLEQSASQRAIENLLKVYYEPLELWFLRTSIEKVCFSRTH